MKKTLLLAIFIFTITIIGCGCSLNSIKGNGNETTKSFNVSDFSHIDASHAFVIQVVVGEKQSVEIETDENLMEYVKVSVTNNTLFLEIENFVKFDGRVKAIISTESLNGIDLSGACKIDVRNISTDNFSVDASGACKGTLSGNVENLNIELSGATKLNTVELIAKNLNINMSGASNLEVYCDNSLTVDASGASKVIVYGDPKKTKTDLSGVSSISQK